ALQPMGEILLQIGCRWRDVKQSTQIMIASDQEILAAPGVLRLVARDFVDRPCAQLAAGHRLEDLGGDREALLPPALRLGAVQHVVRDEAEMGWCSDLAREITGE